MERENRKRGREEVEYLSDQNTRKRDVCDEDFVKFTEEETKVEGNENGADNYMGCVGVFDFPWLKEGVISKSEEWHFEDVFSDTYATALMSGFELSGQCLCESAATCMSSINFPVDMFEENVWSLEAVDDCTSWTSLLNQPIQQTLSNK